MIFAITPFNNLFYFQSTTYCDDQAGHTPPEEREEIVKKIKTKVIQLSTLNESITAYENENVMLERRKEENRQKISNLELNNLNIISKIEKNQKEIKTCYDSFNIIKKMLNITIFLSILKPFLKTRYILKIILIYI